MALRYLCLDSETTTFANGNPFSRKNKLCYVGLRTFDGCYYDFPIEYNDYPYGESLTKIQELVNEHDCIVGFNLKFDLHWLIRYGINLSGKKCFDTQLVEFILHNQSNPYPSLHDTAINYGFEGK